MKISINGQLYTFNNHYEYIKKLQTILNEIEKTKQNKDLPKVNRESIQIQVPQNLNQPEAKKQAATAYSQAIAKQRFEELVREQQRGKKKEETPTTVSKTPQVKTSQAPKVVEKHVKLTPKVTKAPTKKLAPTSLHGKAEVTKETITKNNLQPQNPDFDMHLASKQPSPQISKAHSPSNNQIESLTPKEKPKKEISTTQTEGRKKRPRVNYKKLKQLLSGYFAPKLTDEELLTNSKCSSLREQPIVFVSANTTSRGATLFTENIDIIHEQLSENTPIGAFISGKALTDEKIASEARKISRLCAKAVTSGVICYEVNNEGIKDIEDPREILSAIKAIERLVTILNTDGYTPLICIDLDVKKIVDNAIKSIEPAYESRFPVLARTSSKYLDDVDENSDLIVMHPASDHDQVILTQNTAEYVQSAINKNIKSYQKTSSKVA